jgi:myo-inositol-1(or 4)-monophosphatase
VVSQLGGLVRSTVDVAVDAGAGVMAGLGGHPASRPKGRFDVQVDADLASEGAIVPRLRLLIPGSEIASEEMGGPVDWGKRDVWIVDPLDGTNNYFTSIPYLAVSIALRQHGRLVMAVVRDPVLAKTYTACLGSGAQENGRPLQPSSRLSVDRATVSLITDYSPAGRQAGEVLYLKLNSSVRRVTTLWAPAADLVRTATGHLDAVVCVRAMYGDVCAGLLILSEAGGVAIGAHGEKLDVSAIDPTEPVSFVASSSLQVAEDLLRRLAPDIGRYM